MSYYILSVLTSYFECKTNDIELFTIIIIVSGVDYSVKTEYKMRVEALKKIVGNKLVLSHISTVSEIFSVAREKFQFPAPLQL